MNAEAMRLEAHRTEEMKRLGGLEAYRLHALANLKLKTVVRASLGGGVGGAPRAPSA